jgi:hypothetical protein
MPRRYRRRGAATFLSLARDRVDPAVSQQRAAFNENQREAPSGLPFVVAVSAAIIAR